MKIKMMFSLCLGGMVAALSSVHAAVDVQVYMPKTAFTFLTGNAPATDNTAEPDGVAITSDTSKLYCFDSIAANGDQMVAFDGTTTTLVASKLTIGGGGSVSENDLTIDSAGNLYALLRLGSATHLYKVPGGVWANKIDMVNTTLMTGANRIAIDKKNSRIIIAYTSSFSGLPLNDNIVYLPLTATGSTSPTILVTGPQLSAALGTTDAVNGADLTDITVQSDGSIIFAHRFSSGTTVPEGDGKLGGTLLKISETGTISTFATSSLLITSAGADSAAVNIGNLHLTTLSSDTIGLMIPFTSSAAVLVPTMMIGSADGLRWEPVINETQVLADADVPDGVTATMAPEGGGFMPDGADNIYWSVQGSAAFEVILRVTGIDLSVLTPVSEARHWSSFE